MTSQVLQMAATAMVDPKTKIDDLAKSLSVNRVTLYRYLNSDGSLKELGQRLMDRAGAG